jgi:hypothetical protein
VSGVCLSRIPVRFTRTSAYSSSSKSFCRLLHGTTPRPHPNGDISLLGSYALPSFLEVDYLPASETEHDQHRKADLPYRPRNSQPGTSWYVLHTNFRWKYIKIETFPDQSVCIFACLWSCNISSHYETVILNHRVQPIQSDSKLCHTIYGHCWER